MGDPGEQERNDFREVTYRGDADDLQPGRDHDEPLDEAKDRPDFYDERVAQPGDDPPGETALPSG